ncbi:hypothetical protein Dsin_018087 [Dipteronia sinensis]|uniref:Uncharacterized protein n=1 Tax=Dipteronia sinensis TaxID=43782 RepID=A0AAE0E723_9ROSI|nr:hypothetical protein Dsin_018087 [Dipteronia sinensis]
MMHRVTKCSNYMQHRYELSMTFPHLVTFQGGVLEVRKRVLVATEIPNLVGCHMVGSIVTWVIFDSYLQPINFEKIDRVSFDGTREWEHAPSRLYGSILKRQVDGILTEYKKEDLTKRKRDEMEKKKKNEMGESSDKTYWKKKKSIFFEFPY